MDYTGKSSRQPFLVLILIFHLVSRPSPACNTIGLVAEYMNCLYQVDGNCY